MAPNKNDGDQIRSTCSLQRDIFQRYNDGNSIFARSSIKNKSQPQTRSWITRQPSQTADKNVSPPAPPSNSTCTVPVTNNAGATSPPSAAPQPPPPPSSQPFGAPAAPPPPPPPTLNGNTIPTIRLKSEIPEQGEPPAKLQGAMMKDKKPFTYTPGGIDLSEIKSPRMARRVMRNAQEPEDIVLPPTSSTPVSTASLPPSAIAAMCPQIAIPVFPQNNMADRKPLNSHRNEHIVHNAPPPPPPRQPSPASSPTPPLKPVSPAPPTPKAVTMQHSGTNTAESKPKATTSTPSNSNRTQVGSIYVPPVSETDSGKSKPSSPPTFPTLREAPTPWLNKHQQQQQPDNVPAWRTRSSQNKVTKETEQESKPGPTQLKGNTEAESNKPANGGRVISIQIEGAAPKINHSKRWGTAKDNNETVQSTANNRATEPETKPIQSRSFKVLQKITGSEDDSTDAPYNSEGVPLSQLRKLQLNEDDRAFMNKVKSQVDEDTFLHMESDPRYRGSVIPSRAFRMLQNMTDSGQVASHNVVVIPINHTNNTNTNHNQLKQSHPVKNTVEVHVAPPSQPAAAQQEVETKRNYIPPSERQAEQDLRKYMGSSIPSRSFRMLQAMTATQDSTENVNEIATNIDEENVLSSKIPFIPNPWISPPTQSADVISLWQNYRILYDFVFQQLPHLFVSNCSQDNSFTPSHLSPPIRTNYDPKNSTNIAIVVTDEETGSSKTAFNAQNMTRSRPPTSTHKLKPSFHSEILQPYHESTKALIITQTLIDNSDNNDVSVTVRIPLRKKSSLSADQFTTTEYEQNNAKIVPIECPHENDTTQYKFQQLKILDNRPQNSESNNRSHTNGNSNIILKLHGNQLAIENKCQKIFDLSNEDKSSSTNNSHQTTQMHSSYENDPNKTSMQRKYIPNNSSHISSYTQPSVQVGNINSKNCDVNLDQSNTNTDTRCASVMRQSHDDKTKHAGSVDLSQQNSLKNVMPRNMEFIESTEKNNSEDRSFDLNLQGSINNSTQQIFVKQNNNSNDSASAFVSVKSSHLNGISREEGEIDFKNYIYSHNGSKSVQSSCESSIKESNQISNSDYENSFEEIKDSTNEEKVGREKNNSSFNCANNRHSTQSKNTNFETNNLLEDVPSAFFAENSDNSNRSHQSQNFAKLSPAQSSFSDNNSDVIDDHSDASSVDFWKEIAENEDDLFFKTSRRKSREVNQQSDDKQAENKPVWNLGNDVRDFCNYTELSDSTDTSSTSDSNRNKDSFDRCNENETSNSCSSDENEFYNNYEFNNNTPLDTRLCREDVKSEFTRLHEDDLKKVDHGTDLDEDSGMNSDTGKNFSETEADSEIPTTQDLRKQNIKYVRARTHSRLYRLLLAEEETSNELNQDNNSSSQQSLMLPLNGNLSFVDSVSSSSGINSPISPEVNEKLLNELVQNVLKWKNGPDLSKISLEKLREIAFKSLQGEGTDSSRGSSPYNPLWMNSDLTADTETMRSDIPRQFDFSNPSTEFTDTTSLHYPGYNILPSPAFKTLQSGHNSPKTWPKCPLVSISSSRNYLSKQTSLQNGTLKR